MTAPFSDEQVMIQDMARKFAADSLAPHTAAWDEDKHFPVDVMREAAQLGFAGIYVR
ncbi:MAG: acyl-CoA dehydrogenase family protein, partial [Pseudomonadota bacterium]